MIQRLCCTVDNCWQVTQIKLWIWWQSKSGTKQYSQFLFGYFLVCCERLTAENSIHQDLRLYLICSKSNLSSTVNMIERDASKSFFFWISFWWQVGPSVNVQLCIVKVGGERKCQNPLSLDRLKSIWVSSEISRSVAVVVDRVSHQCKWLENRDLGTGREFRSYWFAIWSCSQNHRNPSIDSYYGPKSEIAWNC